MKHLLPSTLAALLLTVTPTLAANWTVDPAHSTITFTGTQEGREFSGQLPAFTAAIAFNPAALDTSHVEVTLPLAGITAGSPMRDDELPKPEWFNFAAFPTASFTSTSFVHEEESSPPAYTAHGQLTLKGVTVPVDLPFTLELTDTTAHMTGQVTLDRTAFGVGAGNWATDGTVGKQVTVTVDLVATKAD